jgi:hypothetical protein
VCIIAYFFHFASLNKPGTTPPCRRPPTPKTIAGGGNGQADKSAGPERSKLAKMRPEKFSQELQTVGHLGIISLISTSALLLATSYPREFGLQKKVRHYIYYEGELMCRKNGNLCLGTE